MEVCCTVVCVAASPLVGVTDKICVFIDCTHPISSISFLTSQFHHGCFFLSASHIRKAFCCFFFQGYVNQNFLASQVWTHIVPCPLLEFWIANGTDAVEVSHFRPLTSLSLSIVISRPGQNIVVECKKRKHLISQFCKQVVELPTYEICI